MLELPHGVRVVFEHPILRALPFEDVVIVVLSVPLGITDNVFGVSLSGKILWQIPPVEQRDSNPRYVGINREGEVVTANRWDDLHVQVDPRTGRVLGYVRSKS